MKKIILILVFLNLYLISQAQDFDLIIHAQGISDMLNFDERPFLEKPRAKFTKESLKIEDLPELKFTTIKEEGFESSTNEFFPSKMWILAGKWETSEFTGTIIHLPPNVLYIRIKMSGSGLIYTYIGEISTFKYEDRF